jgi:hypothetical protein
MRALVVTCIVFAVTACGARPEASDSADPEAGGGPPAPPIELIEPGPVHVHGLGVNPSDRALYVATHTGLWRVDPDTRQPTRVGDSYQDSMGFTVAGPDDFLGSGHPDVRDGLPPLLGLVRSDDAGRSWTPVSLLGEADFHVLRAAGDRIYGYDASNGRLLVSADAAQTWKELPLPDRSGELVDLQIAPQDRRHLLASTATSLYESRDGGRSWHKLRRLSGLLAWSDRTVTLVDATGAVFESRDSGVQWTPLGHVGGEPAALLADAQTLYVALHDGQILTSSDGRAWSAYSQPSAGAPATSDVTP